MWQDRGALLTGVGLGVGLMYFLEPDRGQRRRALVRDKLAHAATVRADAAGATSRDVANRTVGTVAQVRGAFRGRSVDDAVLTNRVRAQLGRVHEPGMHHRRTLDSPPLRSDDDGRTRVHIRMSHNPPGGWLGHGVAAAFGVDSKSSLDADLARMKMLLESVECAAFVTAATVPSSGQEDGTSRRDPRQT
jgi:hypothetical protein